jgi:hypothetical protein
MFMSLIHIPVVFIIACIFLLICFHAMHSGSQGVLKKAGFQNCFLTMKTLAPILRFIVLVLLLAAPGQLHAQGTAFTYQGRLLNGTNPANGTYNFTFSLFNVGSGGSPIGSPVTTNGVAVTNGLFTVMIDFGVGALNGQTNWLQIGAETNGAGSFTTLTPRQQLTPTPYAIYAETANAAGLSGAIPATDLSGVNGSGLTGVALLAGGNTFSGNQIIGGMLEISQGTGTGYHVDSIIGPGGYNTGEEHSINFDDGLGHIGSLMVGYNGANGYFSVGNLYTAGTHQTGTKALTVFGNGDVGIGTTGPEQNLSVNAGLNIDQANLNAGIVNNGATNGSGLTFGLSSGEGIASQRVATGGNNQYGLDFYTDYAHRMSITQGGLVGIGVSTNKPDAQLEVNGDVRIDGNRVLLSPNTTGSFASDGLYYDVPGLTGINNGSGPSLFGFYGGSLGALAPNVVALSWDSGGDVSVGNSLSTGTLTVRGDYLVVNGGTPVNAYFGDDGSGNDVQIGSQKSGVTAVSCYNTADNAYMHLYVSSITINGGADLAEPFQITTADQKVSEGAVVVIDEDHPGHLKLTDRPYDTRVAGVVSGANGINPGIQMQQQGLVEGGKNVALTGRVYVQADTSNGAIKPGDMLTTSSTPGRAMKVTDHVKAQGAILGKAMSSLNEAHGMVLVLVTLQ